MGKKVYINGKFLSQQFTGVQYFAFNLCLELLREGFPFTILVPSNHKTPSQLDNNILEIGLFTGNLWEQISLPLYLLGKKNTILLNLCNSAPILDINQIVTIHDLAFMRNPKWFSSRMTKWYNFLIPKIMRNAEEIITVSETVKKEIAQNFGIPLIDINVIPNKPTTTSIEIEKVNIPFIQFFLIVGSDNPRKNIAFAARAMANTQFNLVVVGNRSHHFGKTEKITATNIHYTGYLSQRKLNWLYQNCLAVIYPSIYEGFGIPILDTFKHKKPLICSDIEVFKEIAQKGALFFDPTKPEELLRILNSKSYSTKELIENGFNQYQYYAQMNRASKIKKLVS